jgi:hypothetical protein
MTTLEERIAEAMRPTFLEWQLHYGHPAEQATLILGDLARAVVAVLPTADVSDEAIMEALSVDLSAFPDFGAINRALVANVRALLDAQAAAHAAEVGDGCRCLHCEKRPEWLEPNSHSREKCLRCGWVMGSPPLNCQNDDTPHRFASTEAEVEALRAEVERARGDAKAWLDERGNAEWQAMTADRDAYRARIDAVRALCDESNDELIDAIRAALDDDA